MLNQIAFPLFIPKGIGQQFANHRQLMITWENHGFADNLVRLSIDFLDHLRIILQNIRQRFLGQNLFPEIIGLDAIRIGRIACTVIVPLVEWQKPGRLTAQPCTHFHLVVIDRKMYCTSLEVKDQLLRVAVVHVLIDRIIDILFGQSVLQFECSDWQAVYKDCQIQSQSGKFLGIGHLPRDTENVPGIQCFRHRILFRGCRIVKVEFISQISETVAKDVDNPSLAQFLAQTDKKFVPLIFTIQNMCGFHLFGLCGLQEP